MAETPSYRVMSVDPKMGDLDEQFSLIETDRGFGAPASSPGMRKIVVGDSLPEGEVTAITAEGIQVIPDEGDEYVIPLGSREGYKPPVREKTPPAFNPSDTVSLRSDFSDFGLYQTIPTEDESRASINKTLRMKRLNEAAQQQGQFYDTDDPNEIVDLVQEDYKDAFDNQKTREMTETPEGMEYLFEDDDGNISSYFVDEEGDAVRLNTKTSTLEQYTPAQTSSVIMELLGNTLYTF